MKEIGDKEQIKEALKKRITGIKIYVDLMDRKNNIDDVFRKEYKSFYKMNMARGLAEEFYHEYFRYLAEKIQDNKGKQLDFETVLKYFFSKFPNRVEASFSSKLLATVNPNMPVWDKNVLNTLKDLGYIDRIPRSRKDKLKQINETIETYAKLEDILKNVYLGTNIGKKYIAIFDETLQNDIDVKKITDMKKIDLVLWSTYTKKSKKK